MKGEHRKPSGLLAGLSRLGHSKSRKQLAPEPSKWDDMYDHIAWALLCSVLVYLFAHWYAERAHRHIRFSALYLRLYVRTHSVKSFTMDVARHAHARLAGSVCIREFAFE